MNTLQQRDSIKAVWEQKFNYKSRCEGVNGETGKRCIFCVHSAVVFASGRVVEVCANHLSELKEADDMGGTPEVARQQALDALLLNIEQDARITCELAKSRGQDVPEADVLMNVAAQIARRYVARARRVGKSDESAIAEMMLSDSPQLRAIGEDAAWLRHRTWAR